MAVKKQQSGKEKKKGVLTKHVCSLCHGAIMSDQLTSVLTITYPNGGIKSARSWYRTHKTRCP